MRRLDFDEECSRTPAGPSASRKSKGCNEREVAHSFVLNVLNPTGNSGSRPSSQHQLGGLGVGGGGGHWG